MAEIVLEAVKGGPDAGKLTFGAFKFKPRISWKYVVDPYGNTPYIAGVLPVGIQPPTPNDSVTVPGTGGNAVLLESDRFAIFSWGQRDSDPRCRPIIRRAYNAFNLKIRTWPEKLKGDVQFGTPSVDAIMPEQIEDPEPDEVANLTLADGTPVQTAEDMFAYVGEKSANGTFAVWPFGTEIHVRESTKDGLSLNASIELYNREIAAAIIHAPRTTQEGKHGGKNESESSGDVTMLLVSLVREMLCGLMARASKTLIRLNYGEDAAAEMMPEISMGDTQDQDLAAMLASYSSWVTSGAPTESQMAEIDASIGLTPRKPGEQSIGDMKADKAAEQATAMASMKPAPGQVGGKPKPAGKPKPKK